jgi:hypothetical protein
MRAAKLIPRESQFTIAPRWSRGVARRRWRLMIMESHLQLKAIDTVLDWTKSLTGLNFLAGAGCVVVLEVGSSGMLRLLIFGAILMFALAIIIAVIVMRALAWIIPALPLHDATGALVNVGDYGLVSRLSIRQLTAIQLALFVAGLGLLLLWVLLRL